MVKNKKRCDIRIRSVSERAIYLIARGSKGEEYFVTYNKLKRQWTCLCMGFVYKADCYHIESAKEFCRKEGLIAGVNK